MKYIFTIFLGLLLLSLTACQPNVVLDSNASSQNPIDNPSDSQTHRDEYGLIFESHSINIKIEFPTEWSDLISINDESDTIRIDVNNGWDANDDMSGFIGRIYCFAKADWADKTSAIPTEIYDAGHCYQMAENEDSVVILYRYGGLVNYESSDSPGFSDYKKVSEGLDNGEYHVTFLTFNTQ